MEEQKIACLYYPTTVIAVDDNLSILQSIKLKIGKKAPCKTFLIPEEALAYLEKNIAHNKALNGIVSIDTESASYTHDSKQLPLRYDVSTMYENVYNKDSFSEITVIIVDYAMPGMNGEEFCKMVRKIMGKPIKIIMLTGEADDPKAVKLFNAGIIDRFVRKGQPDTDENLKNCIIEMQNNYFKDMTYPVVKGLSSEEDSSLGDPAFIDCFNKICHNISAVSYYLIELSGSFIFFNSFGKPTWLIIKTLDELKEIADQLEADEISEELIDSLRKGDVVYYFSDSDFEYYSDEEKLRNSLHKAQKLQGKKEYRYALIDALPEFPLDKQKIASFNQYMSSL